VVAVAENRLVVPLARRRPNPIRRAAALDRDARATPGLRNLPINFLYT
jgi:hypothetical protein